ncbi:YbaK/prolyl-tRNA synthetase associated domain-containing protein [Candidatus Woesearchaeota archaeon]|nr:YbaK/prolyl-tRNA synthetase associated domain-containing protein [Candidatus Woesearchaeota archaeon]
MGADILEKIRALLKQHNVNYALLEHGHVHSSQDAASVRGTKIEQAAKALVLKEKKTGILVMFVVAGDRRLDLRKIKKEVLRVKNLSLASPEEVLERTTCTVGSVPPFGQLFDMPMYFDRHLQETKGTIVFSAGTHHHSIKLKTEDYLSVAKPIIAAYSSPSSR